MYTVNDDLSKGTTMFGFLFHFLQQHSTTDGYTMMAPIVAGFLVLIGLLILFVALAKVHERGIEEGQGSRKEAYNEGFEQGTLHGELTILAAEDAHFSE